MDFPGLFLKKKRFSEVTKWFCIVCYRRICPSWVIKWEKRAGKRSFYGTLVFCVDRNKYKHRLILNCCFSWVSSSLQTNLNSNRDRKIKEMYRKLCERRKRDFSGFFVHKTISRGNQLVLHCLLSLHLSVLSY